MKIECAITKFDIDARGLPIISDDGIWVSLADHQAAIAAALAGPASTSTNWRPLHEYEPSHPECELVQVLCEVIADENNETDHISSGDHAVGDQFVSIGFLADDAYVAGVPDWIVAGWCMNHDCFTDARHFKVVAWQPLAVIDLPHGGGV